MKNKMNGIKIIDSFAKLFCHHTNWQNATKAGRTNSRTNCQQNRIAISLILQAFLHGLSCLLGVCLLSFRYGWARRHFRRLPSHGSSCDFIWFPWRLPFSVLHFWSCICRLCLSNLLNRLDRCRRSHTYYVNTSLVRIPTDESSPLQYCKGQWGLIRLVGWPPGLYREGIYSLVYWRRCRWF